MAFSLYPWQLEMEYGFFPTIPAYATHVTMMKFYAADVLVCCCRDDLMIELGTTLVWNYHF